MLNRSIFVSEKGTEMKARIFMLAPLAFTCITSTAPAANKEFLLLPMSAGIGNQSRAVVVESSKPVTFKTIDCGNGGNVGEPSEYASPLTDKDYTGTAYAGEIKVEGAGTLSGFVMAHQVKVGTRFSNFTLLNNGQTCSEMINGKPFVFRKYTAVWQP